MVFLPDSIEIELETARMS